MIKSFRNKGTEAVHRGETVKRFANIGKAPEESDMRIKTHPGEVLREEYLGPLRLSANALAIALRVPVTRISEILHARRGVTADTALRLARYFGTSPEFWLNLQQAHDLSIAARERGSEIEREVNPRAA